MKTLKNLISLFAIVFSIVASNSVAQTFVGPGPLAPNMVLYDAAVATGPNNVIAAVNYQWNVYDKTGVLLASHLFSDWFGTNTGLSFNPKAYYDISGHYVLLTTSYVPDDITGVGFANVYVSVSQTSDPTGAWWNYTFDWRYDNNVLTDNWGENPGLGFDDNSIYITTDQFPLNGDPFFQYSKIRVLNKAQLFSGVPNPTFVDFTGLTDADGRDSFALKPSRAVGSSPSGYFINANQNGASTVTLWRIDNSDTVPVLTRVATVPVRAYALAGSVPQAGGRTGVWVGDCRIQDVTYRNGVLYTCLTEKGGSSKSAGAAAVRYLEIQSNGVKNFDITYTGTTSKSGVYYPAVSVDSNGNVALGFNRSSSSEYISLYYAKKSAGSSTFGANILISSGTSYITNPSWGHFNAVHNDGPNGIWFMAGVALHDPWRTVIGHVTLP